MILQVIENKPTNNQYAYFFAGIIKSECLNSEIFQGYTATEVRELFEEKFLWEEDFVNGRIVKKEITIEDVSKKEFSVFIEKVIAWLAQNEIIVKSPEEYYYEQKNLHR